MPSARTASDLTAVPASTATTSGTRQRGAILLGGRRHDAQHRPVDQGAVLALQRSVGGEREHAIAGRREVHAAHRQRLGVVLDQPVVQEHAVAVHVAGEQRVDAALCQGGDQLVAGRRVQERHHGRVAVEQREVAVDEAHALVERRRVVEHDEMGAAGVEGVGGWAEVHAIGLAAVVPVVVARHRHVRRVDRRGGGQHGGELLRPVRLGEVAGHRDEVRPRLEVGGLLQREHLIGGRHAVDAGVRVGRHHEGERTGARQGSHRQVDGAIAAGRDRGPERPGVESVARQHPDDAGALRHRQRVGAELVERRVARRLPEHDAVGEHAVGRGQQLIAVDVDEHGAGHGAVGPGRGGRNDEHGDKSRSTHGAPRAARRARGAAGSGPCVSRGATRSGLRADAGRRTPAVPQRRGRRAGAAVAGFLGWSAVSEKSR